MSPQLFYVLWGAFAGVAVVILRLAGKGRSNALIDERNRYSLTRFQLLMWTLILIPAFAALFCAKGFSLPSMSDELLGLLGIAAGSATAAGAVKNSKDIQAASAAAWKANAAARAADLADVPAGLRTAALRAAAEPAVPSVPTDKRPHFMQILLEEEGDGADQVVSVTKFQCFILTLVAGLSLVVLIVAQRTLELELPREFLWLIGISQGTYVGGKIPNRAVRA